LDDDSTNKGNKEIEWRQRTRMVENGHKPSLQSKSNTKRTERGKNRIRRKTVGTTIDTLTDPPTVLLISGCASQSAERIAHFHREKIEEATSAHEFVVRE